MSVKNVHFCVICKNHYVINCPFSLVDVIRRRDDNSTFSLWFRQENFFLMFGNGFHKSFPVFLECNKWAVFSWQHVTFVSMLRPSARLCVYYVCNWTLELSTADTYKSAHITLFTIEYYFYKIHYNIYYKLRRNLTRLRAVIHGRRNCTSRPSPDWVLRKFHFQYIIFVRMLLLTLPLGYPTNGRSECQRLRNIITFFFSMPRN